MASFRFHYIAMPHLPVTRQYMACAFTQKIHKLTRMLLDSGHEVYLYGVGYTDIEHSNLHFIQCVTLDDIREQWGDGTDNELGYDWENSFFRHDLNKPRTKCSNKFFSVAVHYINKYKKPDDFLLLSQGFYHKPIADKVKLYLTCEPGIGYRGSYAPFRAFESSYIQNFTYGSEQPRKSINGNWYDRVIPNYFDPGDFRAVGPPEDYLSYLGRITPRKGVAVAMKVADYLKIPLLVAGQGLLSGIGYQSKYTRHIGVLNPWQRNLFLGKSKVNFLPTIYLEPFGGTSIEANLCGTPSITTNFGVFPETIVNGLNGYRCDTLDDFVKATIKSFELDRYRIRQHALAHYSMQAVNVLFEKWWRDLRQLYLSTIDKNINGWHYIGERDI